jgi:hypothetical protein
MSSSMPLRFYVTNNVQKKIFVFDEDWNYLSNKSIPNRISYITRGTNCFYMIFYMSNLIVKTDQHDC